MDNRAGVVGTTSRGVFFSESPIPKAEYRGFVSVEISRQNSTLSAVKEALAAKATNLGANAISDFKYGQRSHPWWEQVLTFKMGYGVVVRRRESGANADLLVKRLVWEYRRDKYLLNTRTGKVWRIVCSDTSAGGDCNGELIWEEVKRAP